MALEFDKLTAQVSAMGQTAAQRSNTASQRLQDAGDFFMMMDNDAIWDQIMLARRTDAGFRGAAPHDTEAVNAVFPLPSCPDTGTIIASDGSQIYPDIHAGALYWLTNISTFTYFHNAPHLPVCTAEPSLYYEQRDVRDNDGRPIANAAINARRSVYEMQMLAQEAVRVAQDGHERPLIALYDGPLLSLLMGKDVQNSLALMADYHEGISLLQRIGAGLAGYTDRPSSRFLIYTLYLMSLKPEQVRRGALNTTGEMETLNDADIFKVLLPPGSRSAIMIQQSPQNKEYRETHGDDHEIAFFYLNVASANQDAYLARVEVPRWIEAQPALIDALHALIYSQCQITDRYPYVLTRADEIAVVQPHEKRALDELIAVEMLRNSQSVDTSQKLSTKGMARSPRQSFRGV